MREANLIVSLIEQIADTGGRIEKEKLIAKLVESELGRFILKWTYDPFITFGIKPAMQDPSGMNLEFRTGMVEKLLNKLAQRELTGHAAQRELAEVMMAFDKDGQQLLYWILSKDLKAGIAITTINTVFPNLIPVFSVQRAHAYEERKVKKWPVVGEPKLDGLRTTFRARDSHGGFFSRSGKRFPALDFLVGPMLKTAELAYAGTKSEILKGFLRPSASSGFDFIIDSEAMTGLFNSTGAVRRKSVQASDAEIHMFEINSGAIFDAEGSVGEAYMVRRKLLEEFFGYAQEAGINELQMTPRYFLNNDAEVQEYYDKFLNKSLATYLSRGDEELEAEYLKTLLDEDGVPKKLEGMIVKHTDDAYEKRKSYSWMKLKGEETEDLPIVGFFNGKSDSKYANILGGAIVDRKGVEVRIGGGWSDPLRQEMAELWAQDAALLGIDPNVGFDGLVLTADQLATDGLQFANRLIEVKFHEVTPDGSLRHPNFRRFRDDKAGEVEKLAA